MVKSGLASHQPMTARARSRRRAAMACGSDVREAQRGTRLQAHPSARGSSSGRMRPSGPSRRDRPAVRWPARVEVLLDRERPGPRERSDRSPDRLHEAAQIEQHWADEEDQLPGALLVRGHDHVHRQEHEQPGSSRAVRCTWNERRSIRPAPLVLAEEQGRDQEARQPEEDRHAQVAAGEDRGHRAPDGRVQHEATEDREMG